MITEENLNDPIFMERLKFIGPPLDVFKAWTNISEIVSEKFEADYDTVPTDDVVNYKIEYIHKNIKTVGWHGHWLDDLKYFVPNGEKERPARFFKESRFEQWQLVRHASPHQMQFLFVPHQIFFYSTDLLQIVDCYKHRKARIEKDNRKIMESWHDKLTHLGMWRDFGMQYLRYTKLPSNYTKESIQRDVENFWKKPARGNVATIGPPTTIDTHAPVRALVTNEYITPQIATTDKLVRMRQFIRTLGIEDFKEKTNVMHIIEKSSRIKISTGTVEELFEAYNRNRIELLDWTDTSLMCLQLKICSDFSCECSVCTFMRDGTYNQNDPNDSVLCLGTPERVVINLLDDTP